MHNYYIHVFILFSAFFEGHSKFAWNLFLHLYKPLSCTRKCKRKDQQHKCSSVWEREQAHVSSFKYSIYVISIYIQPLASLETKAHISWSSCLNEFAHTVLLHLDDKREKKEWYSHGRLKENRQLQVVCKEKKQKKIPNGISKHTGEKKHKILSS